MYYLSFYDLECDPKWDTRAAIQEYNETGKLTSFEDFLYSVGLEVQRGYELQYVQHRSLKRPEAPNGKVVLCFRIEGYERKDSQWLKSGAASSTDETYMLDIEDVSLQKELTKMSKRISSATTPETKKKKRKE